LGPLPPKFTGLAVHEKNLVSMQLMREKLVVGFADPWGCGVTNFLGHECVKEKARETVDNNYRDEEGVQ
jgi:pyrimidine and pyridine-specific 5'-nucleotidase